MVAEPTSRKNDQAQQPPVLLFEGIEDFDVKEDNGRIRLVPADLNATRKLAEAARARFDKLGITEQDIADAIARARGR